MTSIGSNLFVADAPAGKAVCPLRDLPTIIGAKHKRRADLAFRLAIAASLIILATGNQVSAEPPPVACGYHKLEVLPVPATNFGRYVGQGKKVQIVFTSDFGRATDVFPDPPTVIDLATKRTCNIATDQLWIRGQIYLNSDESRLLADQGSGSWEALFVYDVRKCSHMAEMTFDGRLKDVGESTISIELDCGTTTGRAGDRCVRKLPIVFDENCIPRRN